MQRGKKPFGANDLRADEAIKARIRLLGKMTEYKPLVVPSSVDADALHDHSQIKSERYLAFIREVGEVQESSTKKNASSPQKETEWLLNKVRNLMDKITTENKEEVFNEFLSYEVTVPQHGCKLTSPAFNKQVYEVSAISMESAPVSDANAHAEEGMYIFRFNNEDVNLFQVFEVIFEHAVKSYDEESEKLRYILAELCNRQIDSETIRNASNLTIFQCAIMGRLQFAVGKMLHYQECERLGVLIRAEKNTQKRKLLGEEIKWFTVHSMKRALSIMRFIGAIFNKDIINCRIVQFTLEKLMSTRAILPDDFQSDIVSYMGDLAQCTMKGMMMKEEECRIWFEGFTSHLVDLVDELNPHQDIRVKVSKLRRNFLIYLSNLDSGEEKTSAANNSVNVDAIKAGIRLMGKMTEFKPLVDPSKIDAVKLRADMKISYQRYRTFINEVGEIQHPVQEDACSSPQKETEWLLRKVRNLMDKITSENKEEVFNGFLSIEVTVPPHDFTLTSPEFDKHVYEVFEFIFEKAVNTDDDEAGNKLRSILADLCKRQIDLEPKQGFVDSTVFQCAIRRRLKHGFIKMLREKNHLPGFSSDKEREAFMLHSRARALYMLKFMGDLFNKSIFKCGLIQHCLKLMDVERRRLPQQLQMRLIHFMGILIECTGKGMIAGGSDEWLNTFITSITMVVDNSDFPEYFDDFWRDIRYNHFEHRVRSGAINNRY